MNNPLKQQVGGIHYKNQEYQVISFLMDTSLKASLGYAVKYISRYPNKNRDDLDKALHCIELFEDWFKTNTELSTDWSNDPTWIIPMLDRVNPTKIFKFTHQFGSAKCKLLQEIINLQNVDAYMVDGSFNIELFKKSINHVRESILAYKEGTYE